MVLGGSPRGWGCRRGRRVESDSRFCFSFRFCFMSDLCAHGQSLLIWIFFEDPQGELTRNAYDDDDDDETMLSPILNPFDYSASTLSHNGIIFNKLYIYGI